MPPAADRSDQPTPGRRRRRWARRALEISILLAALYLAVTLISEVGWEELVQRLQAASRPLVLAVTALLAARYLAWNGRWQLALHRVGVSGRFGRGLAALLAAAAVNHLTPSFRVFGGLLRARYVRQAKEIPFEVTYGSVLFDQMANQVVMGALSAVAFIVMALRLDRSGQAVAAGLVILALVLLIPLLLRQLRRRRSSKDKRASDNGMGPVRWLRPLADRGREVVGTVEHLLKDPTLLASAAVLGLLYATLNLAAAWFAFAALGTQPPVFSVFLAVSLGVTLGALSGTPGGSLTTEAAMVTCYGLLGVDRPTALAATLLYRGLHYALILVVGVPSLLALEISHRRARGASGAQGGSRGA